MDCIANLEEDIGECNGLKQIEGGEKKCLNSELWHACAGPLVSLPSTGTRVVYFHQGHSEQVAATTNREVDGHIPNYPSLPPQLICQLHNVTMHADVETDEVYAQMTLQPLTPQEQKNTFLPMELGIPSKQPSNYFCKTLTASDTSTHGGFSVPRRAAEKVFPPLDFSQQPPEQALIARDLHDVEWKFRHIFRGQPKRHLLTTGWSIFVSVKRLVAGDSVLFMWNEKNQLLLGIRRANRPQTVMPSSVLSSDSMHIGLLAAAAHAAATNSCFTVFYNPRASPSEFVIPLSKYIKAVYHTRISVGMRFRMLFETEESSVRRYMGTITGISDLDLARWPNSCWRSVKVGWDESTAEERQPRVSLWEIEPLTTFPMYPSLFPLRFKRPWHPVTSSLHDGRDEVTNGLMWLKGGPVDQGLNSLNFQRAGMLPWMQQRLDPTLLGSDQNQQYQAMLAAGLQNLGSGYLSRQQMMNFQQPFNYLQQSGNSNSPLQLQQPQAIQQSAPSNLLQPQAQVLVENLSAHLLQKPHNSQEVQAQQQQHTYQDTLLIQSDQLHQRQHSSVPSPSYSKPYFLDSSSKFTASVSPVQNMLGSLCPEGNSSLLNLSRSGQPLLTEQLSQQWTLKYAPVRAFGTTMSLAQYSGKDSAMVPSHCNSDAQNSTLFGVNIDSSSLLLPTTVPGYATSSADTDAPTMPLGESGFPSSLYGCMQDSSEFMHSAGQVDPQNQAQTFVKVYKSGSFGRSLDISRFSSYHELREELAQMFGIEGKLENPLISGWQLVFVDRENDVLLLGDDSWESFVNNVWYIKILSPEDIQKMGEQALQTYDVFLSFRGDDTRASFTSHLYTSLQNARIHTFRDDDEVQRGDQVSESLSLAIRHSRIAIIVLSRNYANSRWCMKELYDIMECRRMWGLKVVPVFYGVDPSEVRHQTGDFGDAFEDLLKDISVDYDDGKIWRRALVEVSGIAGFVVINSRNESEDIKKVVEHVTKLLDKTELFVAEHPVGLESRVQDVIQLLNCQQVNRVLLLGIWGMGGIGKTTIAKAIYNQIRRNFEAKSFLLNVREAWEQNNGQASLQERLLYDVHKTKLKIDTIESGKVVLKERLRQKRIFLVLDDVNKLDQLSALCGSREWFGQGSRIIITTRDEDLLRKLKVDHVYRMKEMDKQESLELFSWHAFKQASPRDGFAELSRDLVDYSGGLPLALQVIGSFLLTRGVREWKSVLEKLKVIPNDEVLTKLRISFDGLTDDKMKEIFLDIAFFFIGKDRDDVIEILNDSGLFPVIGISILIQRSLVTVDNKNRLGMHDLLRDMGREIVRQKSPEVAEERSRLWLYEDVLDILSKDSRTTTVKGLTLEFPNMNTTTCLKTNAFKKMKRLRLLQLAGIQVDGDYKYFSRDLRWLCWHGFPLNYIPADFYQGNLVAIELKYSNLDIMWKKSQMLKKLKILNLSHSPNLRRTPDFSNMPNLEKLILKDCPNLSSISHTVGDLSEILLINLKNCTNLHSLPRSIYRLKSLKTLILSGCSKIDKLEEDLEQMESLTILVADKTAITKVPFAIVRSKSIAYVSLCHFEGLARDVFPSIVRSWMSPTNSVLSFIQTSATMSSLACSDERNSSFHDLSSVIKEIQKLQCLWMKCESEVELNLYVERILNTLDANRVEFEAMSSTSSKFVDCGIQVPNTSSKDSLTSLLFQMGMNCHITSILREIILQKMPPIGPGLLPADNYPNWLTFNGEGSSVSFEVPEVNGHDLKTIMCIVYFSSPENITSEGLQNMLVINYTKNTFGLCKRDGLASLERENEWQEVVSNIEPGDKVKVVVIFGNGFTVEKTAIYFIYDDEPIDKKTKYFPKANKNVITPGGNETANSKYAELWHQALELHDGLDFISGEAATTSQNAGTPTLDITIEPSGKITDSDAQWEIDESDDGESNLDKGDKEVKGKAKVGFVGTKRRTSKPLAQATKRHKEAKTDAIAVTSHVHGQYSIPNCIGVLKTLKEGGRLNCQQFNFAIGLTKNSENRVILMSLKDSMDALVEWILYEYHL